MSPQTAEPIKPSPYLIWQFPDFRLVVIGRFCSAFGGQMLSFTVAWDLWSRTHSAFALGLIGLVLVLPVIILALPGGVLADRRDRRIIVMLTQTLSALCAISLTIDAALNGPVVFVYIILAVIGIARAFNDPASSTLIPLVVPQEHFGKAAAWNSSVFQIASITGPAVAGLLISLKPGVEICYGLASGFIIVNLILVALIKSRNANLAPKASSIEAVKEGLRFIFGHKIVLPAITLDLFAVLFGGAVALLPIYATDVLHVGSLGLGFMRVATSLGALGMGVLLAHRPPFKRAGITLLVAVAGFGVCTIIFGISAWFPLSLLMLFALGALDNISVVIRQTLMLTQVPDAMRGRTSAVNTVFISSSNELGDFESGLVAGFIGPIAAVVCGGIGTLIVVSLVAKFWPQMRNLKALDQEQPTA